MVDEWTEYALWAKREARKKEWMKHPAIELVTGKHWADAKFDGRRRLRSI